jgi:hypothetical protein
MTSCRPLRILAPAVACALWALALPPCATAQVAGDPWRFAITPYLWLPTIKGDLKYGIPPGSGGSPEVEFGPADLEFALMVAGEARKGKWSIFTDYVYVNVSGEGSKITSIDFGGSAVSSSLDAGTRVSLRGSAWTLAGGYTAVDEKHLLLDVIGGFRYFRLDTEVDWQLSAAVTGSGVGQTFARSGSLSQDVDLWDGIAGVRGRLKLGDGGWFLPYYADVGTGSSSLTWQAMGGVGYAFSWGDIGLVYRHLFYDQDDDKLIQDFTFSGPALGASIRF